METASFTDSGYSASPEQMSGYSSTSSSAAFSPGGGLVWESSDQKRAESVKSKRVECPVCGKFYASKKSLKIHNRIHTGYKPYKCDLCSKCFSQTNVLKAHINAHTGQRDWSCSMCHKRFTQSAHLRTHEKTHFNRKDFNCTHCGVRDRHMRQHTGEKPFQCHQCQKQFTRGESLRFHMNAHKGLRPYRCTFGTCASNFTKQSSLKRHVKACHTPPNMVKLEDTDLEVDLEDIPDGDNIKNMSPAELERHFAPNREVSEAEFSGGRLSHLAMDVAVLETSHSHPTQLEAYLTGHQRGFLEQPHQIPPISSQFQQMKMEEDMWNLGNRVWYASPQVFHSEPAYNNYYYPAVYPTCPVGRYNGPTVGSSFATSTF